MKICGKCIQIKEFFEFFKSKKTKDGFTCYCKVCYRNENKKSYIKNKEKRLSKCKEYRNNNKEKTLKYYKNYYENNKDKVSEKNAKYNEEHKEELKNYRHQRYCKNKERVLERNRTWFKNNKAQKFKTQRAWAKANKEYVNFYYANYRAKKKKRTPKWLTEDDFKFIQLFYKESSKLTKETGIEHEVDHIVPLQGKNVTGLHVPWNLQILTAEENRKKFNKYEQEDYS